MNNNRRGTFATISAAQARRIALRCQLLTGTSISRQFREASSSSSPARIPTPVPKKRAPVLNIIQYLGYIQIDTISVIERAHHHTLWTRYPKYDSSMIDDLLAVDRRVFEYWGHAASYLPIEDYRYYLPKMRAFPLRQDKWHKERLAYCGKYLQPVLKRIRDEGPLTAKDFEDDRKRKRAGWWDWKPAKTALEMLMWQGDLIVCARNNFQRVYELPERFLTDGIDTSMPSDEELGDFLVLRALQSYGIATVAQIKEHLRVTDKNVVDLAVNRQLEAGALVQTEVEGANQAAYLARADVLQDLVRLRRPSPRLLLLSPFDNLVIQRDRLQRLFNFDYTIECYVPEAKRKHGYFVLPILWGDKLVGRLDPKADRKTRVLSVSRLKLEPDFDADDTFVRALAGKLTDLARFCGCTEVVVGPTAPSALRKPLNQSLSGLR